MLRPSMSISRFWHYQQLMLQLQRGGGGGKGGCENVRPENNFSKNREREITFTEIREREIRK